MSYAQSGNLLNYFIPNLPLATTTTAPVLLEMDIGAASADHGEMICVKACTINLLGWIAVGEIPVGTTTAPTVIFKKRPTPLSATDESTISTLQITTSLAIGSGIIDSDLAVDMEVGDSLEISHTIGVDGTVAGKGFWFGEASDKPELVGNNAEFTETI
jgi:hypothetical protein